MAEPLCLGDRFTLRRIRQQAGEGRGHIAAELHARPFAAEAYGSPLMLSALAMNFIHPKRTGV